MEECRHSATRGKQNRLRMSQRSCPLKAHLMMCLSVQAFLHGHIIVRGVCVAGMPSACRPNVHLAHNSAELRSCRIDRQTPRINFDLSVAWKTCSLTVNWDASGTHPAYNSSSGITTTTTTFATTISDGSDHGKLQCGSWDLMQTNMTECFSVGAGI
eukprot:358760-Chlamydomonas_euryale.AAC.7